MVAPSSLKFGTIYAAVDPDDKDRLIRLRVTSLTTRRTESGRPTTIIDAAEWEPVAQDKYNRQWENFDHDRIKGEWHKFAELVERQEAEKAAKAREEKRLSARHGTLHSALTEANIPHRFREGYSGDRVDFGYNNDFVLPLIAALGWADPDPEEGGAT